MDHAAHRRPPAEGCPVKPNILEPPIGSCRSHHRTIPEEKIGTLVPPDADRLNHLDGSGRHDPFPAWRFRLVATDSASAEGRLRRPSIAAHDATKAMLTTNSSPL